ncbi:cytochrome P450 71A1-like [Dendrobium catenatum]|uniref:Cytochrome P450 71A1 n=1 Tax=Dendrobium catenatum TaxID=906689 RepID=A0A2I0WSA0_9ASPA|nr:cytochrome P450 71A1-like [Dendrobium catenatum]PKU78540.1 Cytochrome P450 71A1 [Dendrobium catenatum]
MMNPILLAAIPIISYFFLLLARMKVIPQNAVLLPSPPRLPIIGNLHQLGSILHRSLYKLSKQHGPLMLLHLGTVRTLVVSCPKIAEEVIRNNDLVFATRPKSKVMGALSYNKNDIAFAQYGESWRQMKKLAKTHLLSSQRVKSMSSDRAEEVSLLLEKVADAASRGNGVICLTEILNSYVTNVITRAVLGSWVTKEKKKLLSKLSHESSALFYEVFFEDFFPNLNWLDVLRGSDRKLKNYMKNWDALFEEIIKNHGRESKEVNGKNNTYFIGTLLELQNDSSLGFFLTNDHIRGLTLDMIIAGIDTTFATLDWCMTELVRNPEVMKKVKDELRKVAHGEDMIIEELLGQLSYLKVFIKEVIRLHPSSPLLLPRESLEECQIQGYNIPKQTRLVINAWAFGRDKSYWEAPEQFKPERFFDSNVDYKGKDFYFIPFGVGRRICPGMDFSMVVIEIALANLLHCFDWSLPRGITVEDMDMIECGGVISSRKQKLELVPIASKVN